MRGRAARVALSIGVALVSAVLVGSVTRSPSTPGTSTEPFPAGRWVTISPPLGRVDRPIVEFLTDEEIGVTRRVQRMIDRMPSATSGPFAGYDLEWHIEGSLRGSPLFTLQREVLEALDAEIGMESPFMRDWPIDIVAGRTQKWLLGTMAGLGCRPNLSVWSGVVLMAAAVCGRHVVVSNITGFLWIVHPQQSISAALERRREPPLSRIPYRIVERGATALAHEYAHIWRAAGQGGTVFPDEPTWFSEGFAEFWAGVAAVLANRGRLPYETQHVVRTRDFFDWATVCDKSLSEYTSYRSNNSACEYHLGVIAVEYLYARYSNLETTLNAFARASEVDSFTEAFHGVFGISFEQFQREASRYVARLRRVELAQKRALG